MLVQRKNNSFFLSDIYSFCAVLERSEEEEEPGGDGEITYLSKVKMSL